MAKTGIVLLDSEKGRQAVLSVCKARGIKIELIEDLLDAEMEQQGKLRKKGIRLRFDEILSQYSGNGEDS